MDESRDVRWPGAVAPVLHGEVLVCGCKEADVAVLEEVSRPYGPPIRTVDSPAEMARQVVRRLPLAVFLGLRKRDRARLQLIPILRAVWKELPVIVVADEASLELERRARQEGIFYYFLHPLACIEVRAVLKDILRRAGREIPLRPVAVQQFPKKRSES